MGSRARVVDLSTRGEGMGNERNVFVWKSIAIGVLAIWIATGAMWFSLWNYYVSTSPREMQSSHGRVVPLSSHGIIVYITEKEGGRLKLLNYGTYAFAFAFVLIHLFKKPFGDRT